MNYEEAKTIVEEAELIDPNDGFPDIHYRRIARLLAEVEHSRRLFAQIARDEAINIVGYDGTRYTPDGMLYTEEYELGIHWRDVE